MKNTESVSEINRKVTKDDEKNTTAEKPSSNLCVENGKIKRDKSPTTCQNNVDTANDAADSSRNNADKKNENNHTANQSDANVKRQKTVCYDFKKGMCRRRFCRYPHVRHADEIVFCHDFQNNSCFRANCKFIHRSIEDQEYYRMYGVFPLPGEWQADHHTGPPLPPPPPPQQNPPPNHGLPPPPPHLYYSNRDNMIANQPQPMPLVARRRRSFGMGDIEPILPPKRSHMDDIRSPTLSTPNYNVPNGESSHQCHFVDQNNGQSVNGPPTTTSNIPNSVAQVQQPAAVPSVVIAEDVLNIYRLYEEHNLLRRRVEINEERLQELRATNTYLLQQNEQLRQMTNQRQTQCSCTNTIVNPVTLTTASQQSAAPVLNAVSIAPVQMQATPIVSIASIAQPQTQIIASSAPLAIAANTSQGQQLALASTQQAGQILGTSQITLATAPSMGITMNTSQSLAMSANATQPIISYPVMTHSILPH